MDGYLRVVRGKEHLRCHAQTQSWLEQCGINEEWLERVIIITPSRGEDAVLLEVRKVEAAAAPAAKLSRLENCLNQTSLSETL